MPAGKPYRTFGAPWSGESDVAVVEISADAGKSWSEAKRLGHAVPFAWRLWAFSWDAPETTGRYKVMGRALHRRTHAARGA
ncbi:oxidoreductase molybdopterin-binding protein [Gemmata obscuriglobus]|uniref:Moybdenum cofactor oxidoreductase dimerisation domain-containing protein n=1 Tax=Gemmata obscuriglobus TaxID=114 RepID=A0A2Z3GY00_9BACT|nr:oxidoreductase molybdopterin-binding protein [Gemmata obscuriglobus]AWM38633.1 hypothetical protein C1280_17665 [Gemmata obscuriglobus]